MSAETGSSPPTMRVDLVSSAPKRVLIVVANPGVSTTMGWPVGFWAAELSHPYYEFTERGVEVTIASPDGGKVEMDALQRSARPVAVVGRGPDLDGLRATRRSCIALLEDTPALRRPGPRRLRRDRWSPAASRRCSASASNDDRQGRDPALLRGREAHRRSTATAPPRWSTSSSPTAPTWSPGKTVTGFANVEEDFSDAFVGQTDDALARRGRVRANAARTTSRAGCSRRSPCATDADHRPAAVLGPQGRRRSSSRHWGCEDADRSHRRGPHRRQRRPPGRQGRT